MAIARSTWMRVAMIAMCLYGALLVALGVVFAWGLHTDGVHDWQEVSFAIVLLSFLPSTLLGYKWPLIGARLLFIIAGASVAQVLGITRSTGDGIAGACVGFFMLVGIPAIACGFYFRLRNRLHC